MVLTITSDTAACSHSSVSKLPSWKTAGLDSSLSGTELPGAELSSAKLSGTTLPGAELFGAKLSGAELPRLRFSCSWLSCRVDFFVVAHRLTTASITLSRT